MTDQAATIVVKPEDVTGVGISLKIEDDLSLFALLAADGSINRLGTGTEHNTEKQMCIGAISDPKPFQNVCTHITADVIKWIGGRADPNPKGKICELTISLFLANREEHVIYFKYGSQSIGPPAEVRQLVIATIEQTDPWYEEFKAGVARQRPE